MRGVGSCFFIENQALLDAFSADMLKSFIVHHVQLELFYLLIDACPASGSIGV